MFDNSNRPKILVVVGTRPEVIKMAPVFLELRKDPRLNVRLCTTGQHADLLELALRDFELAPDLELSIMQHGQSLGSLTSRAIEGMQSALENEKPDAVLVHGDTTTTFAASLAAFYAQILVGHVEAGLRTKNMYSPFPEELNRQIVSRLANWNFAPTDQAVKNLLEEGIPASRIIKTGNTIVDSIGLILGEDSKDPTSSTVQELIQELGFDPSGEKTVLVTTHRRENIGTGVKNIFRAVSNLANKYPEVHFVMPLHPNPQIRRDASELYELRNIRVIEPLGYRKFILLLKMSQLVITDSGGIQEEAVTLGKQVLVTRDSTERPEGLLGSHMHIVGSTSEEIESRAVLHLDIDRPAHSSGIGSHVYGDGRAAERIVEKIISHFLSK